MIPNWVDTTVLTPQPRDNEWAREHGLVGRFVVMHSGNVGHAQSLDNLDSCGHLPARSGRPRARDRGLRRAARARSCSSRNGSRRAYASCRTSRASCCRCRSRRRRRALRRAGAGARGLRRPEPALRDPRRRAAGARRRPTPRARRRRSSQAVGCGVVRPAGAPRPVAGAIRELYGRRTSSRRWARTGRAYVAREADRAVAYGRYRALIDELVSQPAAVAA